ncbi:MAG: type II secretion system F family protein [Candidatus Omnitrophota bacterium]
MPKFYYTAKNRTGEKITGVQECASHDELISRLQSKNLVIIDIKDGSSKSQVEYKVKKPKPMLIRRQHNRITTNDLCLFCRQLATLLGAGVTILEALVIISKQVTSRKLYALIDNLKKGMEDGLSFHEAMAKNRSVFSDLWINLVESGEASGNLAVVLGRLASYLERNAQFRSKLISALIYPAILMFVGLGALLFLTIKIIPTFANLFTGFNMELPLLTRILIAVSDLLRRYIFLLIIGSIAGGFFLKKYLKNPEGRKKFEGLKFRLPVFGEFFRILVVERFSSEMSTLVESGVPILYALEISERSVDNLTIAEIIRNIKAEVREGRSLSEPMEKQGFFEPMVIQMVRIGEEVGDLAGMFKKINSFYQEYIETFLSRFTAMFEPIILVFIGLIIGVMVIGLFLPIFQISQIGM